MAFTLTKRGGFRLTKRGGKPVSASQPERVPTAFAFARGLLDELTSSLPIRRIPEILEARAALAGDEEARRRISRKQGLTQAALTQHPIASGVGRFAGILPAFALAGGPARALVSKVPALSRLPFAAQEALRQGGQFGLAEMIQGRPQESPLAAGMGALLGPVTTIPRLLPRLATGAGVMGGLSALTAPPGDRLRSGVTGAGLGAVGTAFPVRPATPRPIAPRAIPGIAPESYLLSPRLAFPEEFTPQAAEAAAREGAKEMAARQSVGAIDLYRARYGVEAFPKREGGFVALPEEKLVKAAAGAVAKASVVTGLGESASPARSADQQGRVTRIIDALKQAAPIREKQEALYHQERQARVAKMMSVRGQTGGEEGLRRELGTLKGPLPKAQFESLRGKLQEADVEGLLDDINAASLQPFEGLNAKVGLMKLFGEFGGEVPTRGELELLQKVFGPELSKELSARKPAVHRWGLEALNLPRAVMAGLGDLSALFRQGWFYAPRHPLTWTKNAVESVKMFGSERVFQASQAEIAARRTYPLMQENRLALSEIGGPLTKREELFMGTPLLERLPKWTGISSLARGTNRAYVGFLNRMRADIFDSYVRTGERFGLIEKDPLYLRGAAVQVNNATGRGNLRIPLISRAIEGSEELQRAAPILNATLFSPRLVASRLNLLDPKYYLTLPKHVRKEAIKDLIAFAGTGITTLGLLKASGVEVGTDWRSADFGKVKVGNTRYDLFGGFLQPTVAAARLITGQMVSSTTGREFTLGEGYKPTTRADIVMRFLASKESPLARFATGLLTGKGGAGEEFEVAPELVNMFIPMVIQDVYEVMQEHGPTRWWMGLPSAVGVGVQTYGSTVPNIEKTPAGRPTVKFRPKQDAGHALVSSVTGKRESNVPKRLHRPLSKLNLSMQVHKADVDKAKALTAKDGQARRIRTEWGETVVWSKNGVVTTKTYRRRQTPAEAVSVLQRSGQFR